MQRLTDRNHALIALAALGDALVFVLFVALTPIEHGSVEIAGDLDAPLCRSRPSGSWRRPGWAHFAPPR